MHKLCDFVKAKRIICNLTLEELAARSYLSKSYIHDIEAGKKVNISAETIFKLSLPLDVKPSELLTASIFSLCCLEKIEG